MEQLPHAGRLLRAKQISHELKAAVHAWAGGAPATPKATIAEDRLSFTVTLEVSNRPPLDEWAYRFGEGIHHLRASLDNLLVHAAKESGIADPKRLKRIQFPIAVTANEWRDSASRVADLPAKVRDAVQQVQPFNRGATADAVKGDLLVLLRDLSNQDKHQARVITALNPTTLQKTAAIEFETEEGASASVPPDATISVPSFETGGVLYTQRTKGRIAKVRGSFGFTLQVHIVLPDGQLMEISTMLGYLGGYTESVLAHVSATLGTT